MMPTCFLFAQDIDETLCLCNKLGDKGELLAPSQKRTFDEIKILQQDAKTLLVLPTEKCSVASVELPWLAEKKARAALPFALEEGLAENVEHLHIAFDKQYYANGCYTVFICKKAYIAELISFFQEKAIVIASITTDWCALLPEEGALVQGGLLIRTSLFSGFLSAEIASLYLQEIPQAHPIFTFQDSVHELPITPTPLTENTGDWIAKRLLSEKKINLAQGDFSLLSGFSTTKTWYIAALSLAACWLLTVLLVNGIQLFLLHKQESNINTKIATLYYRFFPHATQVISPRFRVQELLQNADTKTDTRFWILLNQLAMAAEKNHAEVESLRYQNNTILVSLLIKNFSALGELQSFLKKTMKVKQRTASLHKDKVASTLELTL